MVKKKKLRGLPVGGPFTPLLEELHDSRAYLELTGNAAKLLTYVIRVARTVAFKSGATEARQTYHVDFDYTYSEAKKRGFSESTFKRAMRELWAKGFLSVIVIGGRTASKDRGRMPSRYRLAEYWKSFGKQWTDRTRLEPDPWAAKTEPSPKDISRW